jgi:hypothetical protein
MILGVLNNIFLTFSMAKWTNNNTKTSYTIGLHRQRMGVRDMVIPDCQLVTGPLDPVE